MAKSRKRLKDIDNDGLLFDDDDGLLFDRFLFDEHRLEVATGATAKFKKALEGTDVNDVLVGNAAPETITAGLGNDIISGGAGPDNFVFDSHRLDVAAGGIHIPFDATGPLHFITNDGNPTLWAQTFTALGSSAEVLTVYMNSEYMVSEEFPGTFDFKLIVSDVNASGVPSGNLLYESDVVSVERSETQFIPVSFDLSGINFQAGQQYAWIVDGYSTLDEIPDHDSTLFNRSDYYDQGGIYLGQPELGEPLFGGPWNNVNLDFAFDLDFHNAVSDGHDIITDFHFKKDVLEIVNASADETVVRDVIGGTEILTPNEGSILLEDVHTIETGGEMLASEGNFAWLIFS